MNDQLADIYTAETKKIAEKHDKELEVNVRKWISQVLGEQFNPAESIEEHLKSGVRLLKLINTIKPNIIPKINDSKLPFQQMENISKYIKACEELGMNEANLFQTVDLFESKNVNQVLNNLNHLAYIASSIPTFKGPHFSGGKAPSTVPVANNSPLNRSPNQRNSFNANINSNANANANANANTNANTNNNSNTPPAHKPIKFQSNINYLQHAGPKKNNFVISKSTTPPKPYQQKAAQTVAPKVPVQEKKSELPRIASVSSLDNDISTKQLFKHDPEMENAAIEWIQEVTGIPISGTLHEWLKDGVVLCKLLNVIVPGTVKIINESKISFKHRENIAQFLKGCEKNLGLTSTFQFQTVDLYEDKNMHSVITSIHVLAKNAAKLPGYKGPQIKQIAAQTNPLFTVAVTTTGIPEIKENSPPSDEEKSMIDWINSHLSKRNTKIERLRSGLCSGVNLIILLEELNGVAQLGVYERTTTNLWHYMQNAALVLQFINQQTGEKVTGCTAPDITTARLDPILNLCSLIRTKFDRDYVFKSQNLTVDSCRIKIVEELMETERTYVKLMGLLSEKILEPIKEAGEIPEEEQANIFSNMSEILHFNREILRNLEKHISDNNSISLPDIFLSKSQFVELYSKYINNFDMASLMVKYNMKKFKSLKKLINKFETEQKEASGLDLSSFLILPVQRLPRYVLLLKELQRYTPENHPEYRGLVNATNHIANSLEIINESKREHEQSSHKMLNIDKSMVYEMDDFEGIVHPKRKYLFEGVLQWEEEYQEHPYWFLFNDILVYCAQLIGEEAVPNKQFRYVTLMPLRFIDDVRDNPDIETAFDMSMEDEIITLQAETVESKEQWKNAVISAKALKVDLDLVW